MKQADRIKELEEQVARLTEAVRGVRRACPICSRQSLIASGPEQWDCLSRRCNSQFYIDDERLLAVRDRVGGRRG